MRQLKEIRESLGLSQVALAKRAGVGISTISNLEKGWVVQSRKGIPEKIADALGVEVSTVEEFHGQGQDRIAVVYALRDPRDLAIYYIGRTRRTPQQRLNEHLNMERSGHIQMRPRVYSWIHSLVEEGLRPELVILDKLSASESRAAEKRHILDAWQRGEPLTNIQLTELVPFTVEQKQTADRARRKRREDSHRRNNEEVRELLIRERAARKWTVREMAAFLDTNYSNVSLWESGSRTIPIRWLDKIRKAFGLPAFPPIVP